MKLYETILLFNMRELYFFYLFNVKMCFLIIFFEKLNKSQVSD